MPNQDSNILQGKVVFLTGGNGFLGQNFVKHLRGLQAKIVVADIEKKAFDEFVSKNNFNSDDILFIETDITSKESLEKAIESTHLKFQQIDCLVNNAYPRNKNYGKHFEDVTYEDFCENTNLHLGGYFLSSQCFLKYFKKQGHGNIVHISSIYGVVPPKFEIYNNTNMTMPVEYAVIKSALIHFSQYIAKYYKGQNIRSNCISPGGLLNGQPKNFIQAYKSVCLNKGMLDPKDIAGSLAFLISDHSLFINGQNIIIDDGFSL